jgi:hypothetical protein
MANGDPYYERMMAAKEITQKILQLIETYEKGPTQMTMNKFLVSVERLADIAEDIEVEQQIHILDRGDHS